MRGSLRIAFFGSSLVSAYRNSAVCHHRGIIRALSERGHVVTFYEPDLCDRRTRRDIPDPSWARVIAYPADSEGGPLRALEDARSSDVIIKAGVVGVFDALLESAVLDVKRLGGLVAFWDMEAPATLDRIRRNPDDPFRSLIPRYDLVFARSGGESINRAYRALGAREFRTIYSALDPSVNYPTPPDPRFEADLVFLGNRIPDRESRAEEFFIRPAAGLPSARFLLGGADWDGKDLPGNVEYVGHVCPRDRNTFNCSARAVLNISRDSAALSGFSPSTRLFEAAGAGACVITDDWEGIELFLEPGPEILVAQGAGGVVEHVRSLTPDRAREIGRAARKRILAESTYAHRAIELESALRETSDRTAYGADRDAFGTYPVELVHSGSG